MSTGCIFVIVYVSSNFAKSLTIVAGLQLIYTNLLGLTLIIFSIVLSSKPFLGGSTIIAVGIMFFCL